MASIPRARFGLMGACVYTCLFGGYETLVEQEVANQSGTDFICFTDDSALSSATWRVVVTEKILPADTRRSSRHPKILPHRYLPEYQTSLYIDNSVLLRCPPDAMLNAFIANPEACLALNTHSFHGTLRDEAEAIARLHMESPAVLADYLTMVRTVDSAALNGDVYWGGMILRHHHHPDVIRAMETWWTLVLRYSQRDQLTLPLALRAHEAHPLLLGLDNRTSHLHEWPVHTRRALPTPTPAEDAPSDVVGDLVERIADLQRATEQMTHERNLARRIAVESEARERDATAGLALVTSSASWRITRPLRAVRREYNGALTTVGGRRREPQQSAPPVGDAFPLDGVLIPDGGLSYRTSLPPVARTLLDDGAQHTAYVTENGVALSLADVPHAAIREHGNGFSIWGDDIYFAASDGTDCRSNGRTYALVVTDTPTVVSAWGTVSLSRPFISENGYAVLAPLPVAAAKGLLADPRIVPCTVVFEDGVPLTTPNAQHEEVRTLGHGRFCLWGDRVMFSSTDGSDCRTNGREYTVEIPEPALLDALLRGYGDWLAGTDEALLSRFVASTHTNNTVFNNFFLQALPWLTHARERAGRGSRAVVLGCGQRPWAAIRLLAEGFEHVIANDLLSVDHRMPNSVMAPFLSVVSATEPHLVAALTPHLRQGTHDDVLFEGLDVRGDEAFEAMNISPGSVDFVCSNSVLEHVMHPEAVYAAMHRMMRPDAVAFHCIDLRDHLHTAEPLRFLYTSDEDYALINTENRLRASDHLRLAADAGFDPEITFLIGVGPEMRQVTSWDEVTPSVTTGQIAEMNPRFRDHSAADLSVVTLGITLRPRASGSGR